MNSALHIACVVFGLLAFALVFMVCGEAGCSACVHACCVRTDARSQRLRGTLMRLIDLATHAGWGVRGAWSGRMTGFARPICDPLPRAIAVHEVTPLRI